MTRTIFILMLVAVFAASLPAAALAGDYHKKGEYKKGEMEKTSEADVWPASEQVETGAVPGERTPSLIDTHHDPFNPNLREIDRAGSRGG